MHRSRVDEQRSVNYYYGAELIGNEAAHAHCTLSDAVPVQDGIAGSVVVFQNSVVDVISGETDSRGVY